jgi:aminopeptidase N
VSTTADQIAVAPGSLQREWTEDNRRFFHYKSDGPILCFYSFLSARYEVLRDQWNDVAIEIYYQKGHEYNLDSMVKAIKTSLDYFTSNFSPYQHKQVRILEFPRYQRFAQSFPNTIPYSEGVGFIAHVDPNDERDIDYPFYITAHEVAHQWWAHQVIGGNVQGATMLSETLAQYSALMVMKHTFGPDKMKRFLSYELDRYLMGRGTERKKEMPLALVENQPYIHYNKGSLVMYALQDYIGESTVNQALSSFLKAAAFQQPPYCVSRELIEHFRQVTPADLAYIIEDLFETITIYDNRTKLATYEKQSDGKYAVHIHVAARKYRADELGEEKEIPINDYIDIGVLDDDGNYLYLQKHKIGSRESEIVVEVDGRPAKAGIDPINKLVDRQPKDNVVSVKLSDDGA